MSIARWLYNGLRAALKPPVHYRRAGTRPKDARTYVELERVPENDGLERFTEFSPDRRYRAVAKRLPAFRIVVQGASTKRGATALDHEELVELIVDDAIRAIEATSNEADTCFEYAWESAGFHYDDKREREKGARYELTLRALAVVANERPRVQLDGFALSTGIEVDGQDTETCSAEVTHDQPL